MALPTLFLPKRSLDEKNKPNSQKPNGRMRTYVQRQVKEENILKGPLKPEQDYEMQSVEIVPQDEDKNLINISNKISGGENQAVRVKKKMLQKMSVYKQ